MCKATNPSLKARPETTNTRPNTRKLRWAVLPAWRATCSATSVIVSVYVTPFIFFFQAEDGIRDHCVTGVQTCALPIDRKSTRLNSSQAEDGIRDHCVTGVQTCALPIDRKSTRLNSSHTVISYAVFCL